MEIKFQLCNDWTLYTGLSIKKYCHYLNHFIIPMNLINFIQLHLIYHFFSNDFVLLNFIHFTNSILIFDLKFVAVKFIFPFQIINLNFAILISLYFSNEFLISFIIISIFS
jgi:hypothetical protein